MLVLVILDGFGLAPPSKGNAVSLADTPNLDNLFQTAVVGQLQASGAAVGLPDGQMGNSEVGHLTIGSGRILAQDLVRINQVFSSNKINDIHTWRKLLATSKQRAKVVHLMGLMSDGGVHSELNHILYMARQLAGQGLKVKLHMFTDGRDTMPDSALIYLKQIEDLINSNSNVSLATLTGRYYAMDRDQRWERTLQAYWAIVAGEGVRTQSFASAIGDSYNAGITDEFIKPVIASDYNGFNNGEAILVANFRADRIRQLLQSLTLPDFNSFERGDKIETSLVAGLVSYGSLLDKYMISIFPPQQVYRTLGEVTSKAGLKQLRLAETEKYAHVTYFLDGEVEATWPECEKVLVPSPKVATYNQAPAMSAPAITELLIANIEGRHYDLIIVNYANADMVGHTGDMQATIKTIEVLDKAIGKLYSVCVKHEVDLIITSDHGNAECMLDEFERVMTSHSCNPVPIIISSKRFTKQEFTVKPNGGLSDIAPTILNLIDLPVPTEMTGQNLLIRK